MALRNSTAVLRAASLSTAHRCDARLLGATRHFDANVSTAFGKGGQRFGSASISRFSTLSHVDEKTGAPTMVDVSGKSITSRTAVACAKLWLPDDVMKLLDSEGEMRSKKGPVFATAIIAGTMACKRTHELIPFCHPLALESCKFRIVNVGQNEISIEATASISGKTGVEMEALTAVSVAALTVYDMCKALAHDIVIKEIKLISKTGGKSDFRNKISEATS